MAEKRKERWELEEGRPIAERTKGKEDKRVSGGGQDTRSSTSNLYLGSGHSDASTRPQYGKGEQRPARPSVRASKELGGQPPDCTKSGPQLTTSAGAAWRQAPCGTDWENAAGPRKKEKRRAQMSSLKWEQPGDGIHCSRLECLPVPKPPSRRRKGCGTRSYTAGPSS